MGQESLVDAWWDWRSRLDGWEVESDLESTVETVISTHGTL